MEIIRIYVRYRIVIVCLHWRQNTKNSQFNDFEMRGAATLKITYISTRMHISISVCIKTDLSTYVCL